MIMPLLTPYMIKSLCICTISFWILWNFVTYSICPYRKLLLKSTVTILFLICVNLYISFLYTLAAILCQLPATSNPKTVGGMCYAIFRSNRVNTPLQHKIIISNQSQPSLQWIPLNKHKSATANHRPGRPDTLSQHAKEKSDKLYQHAKCRQAIPTCIAKVTVYKGMQKPRTVGKQRQ